MTGSLRLKNVIGNFINLSEKVLQDAIWKKHTTRFLKVAKREKIVREQQGKFLWIKAYTLQENYFQSRENWIFYSRTIFLHTVEFTFCCKYRINQMMKICYIYEHKRNDYLCPINS